MMQIAIIGLGAGAAAALLFSTVASGSVLSILLFYLAPLPIMIAALGWSHWAALIAAVSSALALGTIFGGVFTLAFAAGAGVPGWWLGYLAMLARPAPHGHSAEGLEWYPPGRLVVWAAVLGALTVVVAIPNFGMDAESFRAALQSTLGKLMRSLNDTAPAADRQRLIDLLVVAVPLAAAVLATITNTLNLWLAARIVKFSGRLKRPWPVIPQMAFPRAVGAALLAAVALSFVPGFVGIIAGVASASLTMAYGLLGFSVLHAITRGIASRAFILGGVYAAVMVFGWPILALTILGLADSGFDIRGRVAAKRGPPART
jgi:hypothetical protein